MEGDRAHGCITLPVRFGVRARGEAHGSVFRPAVAPDPRLHVAAGDWRLTGNRWFLTALGLALAAWGAYTARLLLRRPGGARDDREPPGLEPHVPDDDGRPGWLCRRLSRLRLRHKAAPAW